MIKIIKTNWALFQQKYDIVFDEYRSLYFLYSSFSYPSGLDREKNRFLDKSLVVEERCPGSNYSDIIYKINSSIKTESGETVGFSPVLSRFSKLDFKIQEQIFKTLSCDAKNLLEEGIAAVVVLHTNSNKT